MCMARLALLHPPSVLVSVYLFALIRSLSGWVRLIWMTCWDISKRGTTKRRGRSIIHPTRPNSHFLDPSLLQGLERVLALIPQQPMQCKISSLPVWDMSVGQNFANGFLNAGKALPYQSSYHISILTLVRIIETQSRCRISNELRGTHKDCYLVLF